MSDQHYDNTNRGALFKNDRREKDSHPEYNGSINVDGVDYWISGWIKDGKKGKFFSLSVKAKLEPRRDGTDDRVTAERFKTEVQRAFPGATVTRDLDDSVPF